MLHFGREQYKVAPTTCGDLPNLGSADLYDGLLFGGHAHPRGGNG
jgi:hypothetical protein